MAERLPWSKFNWDAWDTDAPLAMCSMGAQGFWMRLLCLCAKADGFLLINNKKPSDAELAFITRQPAEQVVAWLAELAGREVFSRDRKGVIYSRRMVSDIKNAAINRNNGKKGGNPKLGKDEGKSDPVNPETENRVKAEKEEEEDTDTESSVPDGTGAEAPSSNDDLADLRALEPKAGAWRLAVKVLMSRGGYPDARARPLVGKWAKAHAPGELWQACEAAWRTGTLDPVSYITAALDRIAEDDSDVFLRPTEARQRLWMQDFAADPKGWRDHERGPKPGETGCRVTPEIQREFGVDPAKPQHGRAAA